MNKIILIIVAGAICLSPTLVFGDESFSKKLAESALQRTRESVTYDGRYFPISYPSGDIPAHLGVCTDVVIRSFRRLGIDLQKRVHEDMQKNFHLYPDLWGMKRPDSNIDHRRVPNLRVFFKRYGKSLPVSGRPGDYVEGDMVTWNLKSRGSLPHIGIVSGLKSADGKRPLVVHNIGRGPVAEDLLFDYKITGHYRFPVP